MNLVDVTDGDSVGSSLNVFASCSLPPFERIFVLQMAEKWVESTNDSPEVVYEGFSPPSSHPQGMINAASSSFVTADGTEDGSLGTPAPPNFMQPATMVENQVQNCKCVAASFTMVLLI